MAEPMRFRTQEGEYDTWATIRAVVDLGFWATLCGGGPAVWLRMMTAWAWILPEDMAGPVFEELRRMRRVWVGE